MSRNTISSFHRVGEEINTFLTNLRSKNAPTLLSSAATTTTTRPSSIATESLLAPSSASCFSASDFPEPPPLPPIYAEKIPGSYQHTIKSYFNPSPSTSPEPSPTLGRFPQQQRIELEREERLTIPQPTRKPSRPSRSKVPSINVSHAQQRAVQLRDSVQVKVRNRDSAQTPTLHTPIEETRRSQVADFMDMIGVARSTSKTSGMSAIPKVPPEPIEQVIASGTPMIGRKSEDAESFKEIRRWR